eukprot:COSAG01_NODE_1026_length_12047_cov_169.108554_4_plen_290_part_00
MRDGAGQIRSARGASATEQTPRPPPEVLSALVKQFAASEWGAEACQAYALEQFNTRRKEDVQTHCTQLEHAQTYAAKQLQKSVVEHYRSFIRTSNDTAEVDEDLSLLRKQLLSLKSTINDLRNSSFDFSTDTLNATLDIQEPLHVGVGAMREQRTCALLSGVDPFRLLGVQQLKDLATVVEVKEFSEGAVLLREGERVTSFWIVDSGECVSVGGAAATSEAARFRRGDCFGHTIPLQDNDTAHFANSPTTITAAGGPCTVIVMPLETFNEVAQVCCLKPKDIFSRGLCR